MPERIEKARAMLKNGEIKQILAWKKGDLPYNPEPAFFTQEKELADFTYDGFCGANLSKYLIAAGKKEGRTLIYLKPCDTYSFNQLIKEHQINREDVYAITVSCDGKLDLDKIRRLGLPVIKAIKEQGEQIIVTGISGERTLEKSAVLLEKCRTCKGIALLDCDDNEGVTEGLWESSDAQDRFAGVKELEALAPEERFLFWQEELSRCIRCNACRNVCPVCTCKNCVFDSAAFEMENKVAADAFEEKLFHIIRAYHVAGRCSDCGECTRVCPENIPLHLLNRKLIKDINQFYGEYQAGLDINEKAPLHSFTLDDIEPEAAGNDSGERG